MSRAPQLESYDRLTDFYADAYAPFIRESYSVGLTGAHLIRADQTAGDWSDAPVSDLVITQLSSAPVAATMDVGGGRFRNVMPQRGFVVVPPGFATRFLIDGTHGVEVLAVPYARLRSLAEGLSANLLPEDGDFGRLHAGILVDAPLTALLGQLWREARAGSPHGALAADGLLLQVAAGLLRMREGSVAPALAHGGLAPWQVRRVVEYLDEHLDEDVALADLAALVQLSPAHFCRAFAQSTGEPPHRYLLRLRVERAQALMADPRLGLAEVALLVGYGSQSAFGTAFRRVVGVSPGEWRRAL